MLVRIGLEYGVNSQMLAWALDYPGCYAYGQDNAEVLLNFTRRLLEYEAWIDLHADATWLRLFNLDFRIVEAFKPAKSKQGDGISGSSAFFKDDRRALTQEEIEHALLIYRWQYEELMAGLEFLPEISNAIMKQERNLGIETLMNQIAVDNYALLAIERESLQPLPREIGSLAQLAFVSGLVEAALPDWKANTEIFEKLGETWSARKVVRRLLWQQRERIDQIKALVS